MESSNEKRSSISWLLEFAGSHKFHYVLSVILALSGVICGLIPYIITIDIVRGLLDGVREQSWFVQRCITIGILWIIRHLLHSLSTTLSHYATFQVLSEIRRRLLKKLSTMPLGTILTRSSGSYKSTIVERVDTVETTLAHLVPEMTSNIIGAMVIFIYLLSIDWRMGLALLIVVPLGVAAFATMMIGYEEKFQRTITSTKALNDTAVEYINGIEVIKAFGQSKTSYAKFVDAAREGAECFVEWMQSCIFGQTAGMTIFPATLIGILPVGCLLYMGGTLTAADFIAVIILSFGVMTPLVTAFSYFDDIAQLNVIMGEITAILEQEDLHRSATEVASPKNNTIELKDVHFGYGEKEILHGVSMVIEPGTVNALVGPSGSGKSTIARLITSLWDVDQGAITLGGIDLKELTLQQCTSRISYVSQDNYLFDMSVMENIRLGKKNATDEEVIEAAKACGCHDFIMSLENGYDTMCGSSGGHLSGGERQRISIARAMLKDAPIVVLDEATSYTDPENEAIIQSSLAKLIHGKTLLVIAHRLSTIADADQIFVVQDGQIIDRGRQEELLDRCTLYQNMWQAHISARDRVEVA